MFYESIVLCAAIVANPMFFNSQWIDSKPEKKKEALEVCAEVADKAYDSGVDPIIAVALSYSESRFTRSLRSSVGAIGADASHPQMDLPQG